MYFSTLVPKYIINHPCLECAHFVSGQSYVLMHDQFLVATLMYAASDNFNYLCGCLKLLPSTSSWAPEMYNRVFCLIHQQWRIKILNCSLLEWHEKLQNNWFIVFHGLKLNQFLEFKFFYLWNFCLGTRVPTLCWLWYIIVDIISIFMRSNAYALEL